MVAFPQTPGNQVGQVRPGEKAPPAVAERCRMLAGQLTRAWALAAGSENLADIKVDVHFYEEVRIWMAKFDAAERAASGRPVPEEVARLAEVADFRGSWWITDDQDAFEHAVDLGIQACRTIDIMRHIVADGDLTSVQAFGIMQAMTTRQRSLFVPPTHRDL